jgi:hypothetical protein
MLALPLLIVLFVLIVIVYYAVVKGWLWKGLLLIGGSFCIWLVLLTQPSCQATAFTIGSMAVSWAATIPLALVALVLMTTKG